MDIKEILKQAHAMGASDIHFKVGSPPIIRVDGSLITLASANKISQEHAVKAAFSIMTPGQRELFKTKNDADLAYSVPGLGRFRCNIFLQRGTIGMVFRIIPVRIPSIDELNLPPALKKLSLEPRGLILVTGTTGSGKSTTLASMIDHINGHKTYNVVTIEDPIEYLHRDHKSIINQREVGSDTESFGKALRAALRQDPDVILVGEMRDFETIQTALTAAETGHLVLSTLHTTDASETVNRIISTFPPYQHKQVRIQLASVLKGVVSMRLIPKADGRGRVPAVEVMIATATIRDCVTDPDKTKLIPDVIAQGKLHYGMQTFDQSLFDLHKSGLITYDEAYKRATNPDDFALRVKGIQSTSDVALEKMNLADSDKNKSADINIERFGQ